MSSSVSDTQYKINRDSKINGSLSLLQKNAGDLPMPALIELIRNKTFKESKEKAKTLIKANSDSLHCRHFRIYPVFAAHDQNKKIILITTPLHEAILLGSPEWVEFLCLSGANVNLNPANSSSNPDECGFTTLELALNPNQNIMGRYRKNHPAIIKILLRFNATRINGSAPITFTYTELNVLYAQIYSLIQSTANKARLSSKHLIILLPELHGSKYSLLLETMIFTVAAQFNIEYHFLERSESELLAKKRFDTWDLLFGQPLKPDTREFLTDDYTILTSSAFNMEAVAVDRCPSRGEDQDDSTLRSRDFVMAKTISEMQKSGIWIVGAAHLQDLIEISPSDYIKTSIIDHFFPKNKFLVLPINVSPSTLNHSIGEPIIYPFRSPKVTQIAVDLKAEAELMTGDEIIEVVRACDYRARLQYITEFFTENVTTFPKLVTDLISDYQHFLIPKNLPSLQTLSDDPTSSDHDDESEDEFSNASKQESDVTTIAFLASIANQKHRDLQ